MTLRFAGFYWESLCILQLLGTYRHSQLMGGSILFGMIILIGGQLLVEKLFVYAVPVSVFITFSFEINRGTVTSLIGPNGAGKSTVMGMISNKKGLFRMFPGAIMVKHNR